MARFWYAYNGTGDAFLPSSYNRADVKPVCFNGSTICAIYAIGAVNPTTLSANLRTYIADVQLTLLAKPDTSLGVKKYVYAKNI